MRYEGIMEKGITIYAAAEGEYTPDTFTVELSFSGNNALRDECVRAYNDDYREAKKVLAEAGVSEELIETGPFAVMAHYEWIYEKLEEGHPWKHREEYRRVRKEVDGYEYEGSCSVKLPMDMTLAKTIWAALRDYDGDFGFSFEYDLEHPEVHERELLNQAVFEARERAKVLATASGVELGAVEAIKHEYRYTRKSEIHTYSLANMHCSETVGMPMAADNTPDFAPEYISVSCSVAMRWALK